MAAITRGQPLPAVGRVAVALEVVLGLGALFGGGALLLGPDGHLLGMSTSLLTGSPFRDYLVPGAVLFIAMGLFPIAIAAMTLIRVAIAPAAVIVSGLLLIGWIAVEMVVLAGWGSVAWTFYMLLGAAITGLGLWWWRTTG